MFRPLIRTVLAVLAATMLGGCAHVISKTAVHESAGTRDIAFKAVIKDIEAFKGKSFIWGGFIVKVENTAEGTYIELVQNPVDAYGRISDIDVSGGRFVAFTDVQLDPLILNRGREMTIAGTLTGTIKRPFGETEYTYPLLEIKEFHLWREIDPYTQDYFIYSQGPYVYPFSIYYSSPYPYYRPYSRYPYRGAWDPWPPWGYPPYFW